MTEDHRHTLPIAYSINDHIYAWYGKTQHKYMLIVLKIISALLLVKLFLEKALYNTMSQTACQQGPNS